MKRDDDLLRLAFGELSDDAARAVEARAGASERAEIEAFHRLHDALRSMPPPPPDSLSADRLRAAILDRDLKVRRPSPLAWLAPLLAPAAVAALAVAVVLPRLRPRAEPNIVMNDLPAERPRTNDFARFSNLGDQDAPTEARGVTAAKARIAAPIAKDTVAAMRDIEPQARAQGESDTLPIRHRGSQSQAAEESDRAKPQPNAVSPQLADANPPARAPLAATFAMSKPNEPVAIATPPSVVVESPAGTPGGTETVVLVSSKRDRETGAAAATEKEVANVLVGG